MVGALAGEAGAGEDSMILGSILTHNLVGAGVDLALAGVLAGEAGVGTDLVGDSPGMAGESGAGMAEVGDVDLMATTVDTTDMEMATSTMEDATLPTIMPSAEEILH